MILRLLFSVSLLSLDLSSAYEVLPGYARYGIDPRLNYDGEKVKFAMGTVNQPYGNPNYLQIPTGRGPERMRVPKAFYHYTEREIGANSNWGIPEGGRLMSTNSMVKNNQREINGIYLPIPNMDPINLHFITQRTFEKGIDTAAHDETPEGALARAKRICVRGDEDACEKALLHYHKLKTESIRRQNEPLHEQLIRLGELTSDSKIHDREGTGMGVVVGLPGYEPLYVGAAVDDNKDSQFGVRFSPPT